jgi:hypothetical protein
MVNEDISLLEDSKVEETSANHNDYSMQQGSPHPENQNPDDDYCDTTTAADKEGATKTSPEIQRLTRIIEKESADSNVPATIQERDAEAVVEVDVTRFLIGSEEGNCNNIGTLCLEGEDNNNPINVEDESELLTKAPAEKSFLRDSI